MQVNEDTLKILRKKNNGENDKTEKMLIRRKIQDRIDQKLKVYKKNIDDRRERLGECLFKDEIHAYHAKIHISQIRERIKQEELRQKIEEVKRKNEYTQQKLLEHKKLQQHRECSHNMRDITSKRILVNSKDAQLMQIAEKKRMREYEKDIEKMWSDFSIKEIHEKKEKEEQQLIYSKEINQDLVNTWKRQMKEKIN